MATLPTAGGPIVAGAIALDEYLQMNGATRLARGAERLAGKEFEKAREMIDIDAARRVAESEGVDIVRPEDVGEK